MSGVGPAAVRAARPGHLAGRRAHRRRRAAVARPRRRGHPHRDRRPRLRRQLAQPARQGAPAAHADRRHPVVRPHERQARHRRASRTTTSRPATARTSRRSCGTSRPGARYTFVNYHTQLELSQAVDWLVNGPDGKPRVDIVVHSNSFLDGPFDGTGVAAQAVNRAHDAGIFWANSAGNYARRHWEGVAGDPDKDGWADIGPAGPRLPHVPADRGHRHGRDAVLEQLHEERRARRGVERAATSSTSPTPRPSSPVVYAQGQKRRLAARRLRRLPADCDGHVRRCASSRGRRASSATSRSSAAASSSATRPRSSRASRRPATRAARSRSARATGRATPRPTTPPQGPTEDGRLKPDVVAPASTAVWPGHRDGRHVGLRAARGRRGGPADAARPRGGPAERPRHDRAGADRRARSTSRRRVPTRSRARAASGSTSIRRRGSRRRPRPASPSATRRASTSPSTTRARSRPRASRSTASRVAEVPGLLHQRLDTRALAPGPHTAVFWARDMAGNRSEQTVAFVRDVTPPTVALSLRAASALDVDGRATPSRAPAACREDRRRDRRRCTCGARCR